MKPRNHWSTREGPSSAYFTIINLHALPNVGVEEIGWIILTKKINKIKSEKEKESLLTNFTEAS